jgi:hypothetical protein
VSYIRNIRHFSSWAIGGQQWMRETKLQKLENELCLTLPDKSH